MSKITSKTNKVTKSIGHLCFHEGFEFFLLGDDIVKAPVSNAIGVQGFRSGRWECTYTHALNYPSVYGFLSL